MKSMIALLALVALTGCTPDDPMFPDASTPKGQCEIQVNNNADMKRLEFERDGVPARAMDANGNNIVSQILAQEDALRKQLFDACMKAKGL